MNRKIALLLLLIPCLGYTQSADSLKRISLGIYAGGFKMHPLYSSTPQYAIDAFGDGDGLIFGMPFSYSFNKRFSFESGLFYSGFSNKTKDISDSVFGQSINGYPPEFLRIDKWHYEDRIGYLCMPLNSQYKFISGRKINLGVSAEFNILFNVISDRMWVVNDEAGDPFGNGSGDSQINLSLKFAITYYTDKNTFLTAETFYSHPLMYSHGGYDSSGYGVEMMGVGMSINFYTKKK